MAETETKGRATKKFEDLEKIVVDQGKTLVEIKNLLTYGGQPSPTLGTVAPSPTDGSQPRPSGPYEEILVMYSHDVDVLLEEPGFFDKDGRAFFGIDETKLLDAEGKPIGQFDAAWGAQNSTFHDLFDHPAGDEIPDPHGDFTQAPKKQWHPQTNWTQSKWTLDDGGSIVAIGPVLNRDWLHKDGAPQVFFSVAFLIVGGTGKYEDARGAGSITASAFLTGTPSPGKAAKASAVHVLKLLRKENQGAP